MHLPSLSRLRRERAIASKPSDREHLQKIGVTRRSDRAEEFAIVEATRRGS
jgi:hypothetical protein